MSEDLEKQGGKQGDEKPKRNFSPEFLAHQFKKGQSGNPAGRKKGRVGLTTMIREALLENDAALAKAVARTYIKKMLKGEFRHLKEFLDRDEGPVGKELKEAIEGAVMGAIFELAETTKKESNDDDDEGES